MSLVPPATARLPALCCLLVLMGSLCARDSDSVSGASGAALTSYGGQVPTVIPRSRGPAPLDFRIDTLSEGGQTASILVSISPAHATLVTGQSIALAALTDDRFGVAWSVSPRARAIEPSSSYNQAPVIFTAPAKPGTYTVTATSMSDPSQSRSVTIAVMDPPGVRTSHVGSRASSSSSSRHSASSSPARPSASADSAA